jgi:hypothetical protein
MIVSLYKADRVLPSHDPLSQPEEATLPGGPSVLPEPLFLTRWQSLIVEPAAAQAAH